MLTVSLGIFCPYQRRHIPGLRPGSWLSVLEGHSGLTFHTVRLAVFSLGSCPAPYTHESSLGPINVCMWSALAAGGAGLGSWTCKVA